jgi:hypothetical protein
MPHLVKVQDQYRAQGLIIIASHSQDVSQDKVVALCRAKKVNYTVQSYGSVSGDTGNTIPHAFLFDASGKCVKDGSPDECIKLIDDLVKKEPHWICQGKKLESAAKAVPEGLKSGRTFGWALAELETLSKKPNVDDKTTEEIGFLKEQINAQGKRELADAKALEESNAFKAEQRYAEIAKAWKKTDQGQEAEDRAKELKKDKAFQDEVYVGKVVAQIEDLTGQMIPVNNKYNIDYAPNRPIAQEVLGLVRKLKAKPYSESKTGQQCIEGLKTFGF